MTLEDVKTGDKVVYSYGTKFLVMEVEKRTPKRIYLAGRTDPFKITDGQPVSRGVGGQISPMTEENAEKAREWQKQRDQRLRQAEHDEQQRKQRYKDKLIEVSQMIREAPTGAEAARILENKVWELTN